jgi:serine/threonine protein kinase
MDDRYEIRGKVGQGGIGAVYRAYDKNLSREVAVKRILPEGGAHLEKEATRQLTKEAGALSALQHPHIVTIYDVGIDEDGPYVVMELLNGKTIDEVVEKASFTWQDFREFALQTQEALVAAQDMTLVHRDLKPTNVMLTWLPSGKFQVKIVDFGLAKFSPKPSLQTIDQKDSIFGSIFFMSPEQFERTELDFRTDMYSIGCVYYYALTGVYPFNGETGPQVMVAHLDHRVYPLNEIRPDLPRWVCDWVMWHINRLPDHRPKNAREALGLFLQSDLNAGQQAFQSEAQTAISKPELATQATPIAQNPIAAANSAITALIKTAPQPILPPEGFGRPSIHTASQPNMQHSSDSTAAPNAPAPAAVVTPTTTPVPVAPSNPEPTPDLAQILKVAEVEPQPEASTPTEIVAVAASTSELSALPKPAPAAIIPTSSSTEETVSNQITATPTAGIISEAVPSTVIATAATKTLTKSPNALIMDQGTPKPKPRLLIPGAKPVAAPAIPVAAPAIPVAVPAIPAAAPAIPAAAPAIPAAAPAIPAAAPAIPVAVPAIPAAAPAIPVAAPAIPVAAPAIPVAAPAIPVAASAGVPIAPPPIIQPAASTPPAATVSKPVLQVGHNPIAIARPIATATPTAQGPQTSAIKATVPSLATKAPIASPSAANQAPSLSEAPATQLSVTGPKEKKGLSNGAKASLAVTLGLITIILAFVFLAKRSEGKINKRYNELVALAATPGTSELEVNEKDLQILLNNVTSIASNTSRETVYKALFIAKATDSTDVDDMLIKYATTAAMPEDIRVNLLRRVIGGRKHEASVDPLIAFINSNPKPESASAALEAIRGMASDAHFKQLLSILEFSQDNNLRKKAEEAVVTVLNKSSDRIAMGEYLGTSIQAATSPEIKQALLRVYSATGSENAKTAIKEALKSSDKTMQIAAAAAFKNWPNDEMFSSIIEQISSSDDENVRTRMFQAAREFLAQDSDRSDKDAQPLWTALSKVAKTAEEQESIVRGLVTHHPTTWALDIIKNFYETSEYDRVIDISDRAMEKLKSAKEDKAEKE